MDTVAVGQFAIGCAEQDAKAAFLKNIDIVIIGIPHGPAGWMFFGLFTGIRVDQTAVAVGPIMEFIVFRNHRNNTVINIPIDLNARSGSWRTRSAAGHSEWSVHNHFVGFFRITSERAI